MQHVRCLTVVFFRRHSTDCCLLLCLQGFQRPADYGWIYRFRLAVTMYARSLFFHGVETFAVCLFFANIMLLVQRMILQPPHLVCLDEKTCLSSAYQWFNCSSSFHFSCRSGFHGAKDCRQGNALKLARFVDAQFCCSSVQSLQYL